MTKIQTMDGAIMTGREVALMEKIEATKEMLKQKVEENGLYENFGRKEVRDLGDEYIDISDYTDEMNRMRDDLYSFSEWCANYNFN